MFGEILGGAIGGLFGGSESSSTSESNVWGEQENYLKDIYQNSQGLYNQGWQAPGVADFNNIQNDAMTGMLGYANTTGMDIANNNMNQATQLMGGYDQAQNYYGDLMNGGTQFNANANQFINSDLVNGQINAANSAVDDQFGQAMNGIASQSAGGGNTGSTRRAAAEAMMAKEAAGLKSNNVSNIQNNAYQNAMNQMNLGANNTMNMANQGTGMMGDAYSMGLQPYQTALNVGGMKQDMSQTQYDWQNNNEWDLLGRYQAAIGNPTVLGSSTSSTADYNNDLGKGLMGGLSYSFFDGANGYGLGSLGYGASYDINPLGQQASMLSNQW
ncbi:hypothetical protein [Thiomicrorhabdus sp. Kp2]|uniref:hypothetical protein n=1 Tax=Thiomicrorhabdus sp. Kp2 TaxID=1123518 RepID=UPI0003FEE269|nr:hypothetical protein [Thiomicrorhabdus sp. Kp2]